MEDRNRNELNMALNEEFKMDDMWKMSGNTITTDNTTDTFKSFTTRFHDHDHYGYGYSYPTYVYVDKTEKAFKIIKTLMDKKTIKLNTVKQFIDLVDEITKIL